MDYHQRLRIAKEVGDRDVECHMYRVLAASFNSTGNYPEGIEYANQGMRVAKETGDRGAEGHAHRILSWSHISLGDYAQGTEHAKQGLLIAKEVGDRGAEGHAHRILAESYSRLGKYQNAIESAKQGITMAKEVGDRGGEGHAYRILADSYNNLGNYRQGIKHAEEGRSIAEEMGDKGAKGYVYKILALSYVGLGDYRRAIEFAEKGIRSAKEMGDTGAEGHVYRTLAGSCVVLGEYRRAIEFAERGLRNAKEMEDTGAEGHVYRILASSYVGLGDYQRGAEYAKEGLRIAKEAGDRGAEGQAYSVLSESYIGLGDYQQGKECASQGIRIAKEAGISACKYSNVESKLAEKGPEALTNEQEAVAEGCPQGGQDMRPGCHPGTDEVYNMTTNPRGIALIINNRSFDHHPEHGQLKTRKGSLQDLRQLRGLFKALGFVVKTKEDLSKPELLNELDSVASKDHSSYDCFVLWLMSHGKSGEVFCSDGETLPIKTAHDKFSNCETLRGKPKLFFIQACRGKKEDEGVAVMRDDASPSQCFDPSVDKDKPSTARVSPTHADFLYAYATVDEYVSYRHSKEGSFFVSSFVEAFRERAAHDHLLDILTNVNNRVSEMVATLPALEDKSEIKDFKQASEVKYTLRKKVRF